ncbi:protein of unknown function [Georgfuchsia toluolica]|uniref:Uncharacterized protein n=1 Tax=Georgfuchsia toluolica TaxID=424218 RepID=A0A916J4I6_9PROT|nr:HD domain-containing phosphohydrolase [Georgfuchsia toluolica]CAG4883831.1 protein of unknown function [Georgfuchsia toluolica]
MSGLPVEEGVYHSLFNNLLNGLAYCRIIYEDGKPVDYVYLAVNAAFTGQTGLANVVGKRASEAIPGLSELDGDLIRIYGRVVATGRPERFDYFVVALQTWFHLSVYSPAQDHFVTIFDVISERKVAEAKIQRLSRFNAALNQCNQAMVRCTSERELFPQICRAAVEFGGMTMAWIGVIDGATLKVLPVDSFGDDNGYLSNIDISIDAASRFGCGPTGIALRENRPYWCQDFRDFPVAIPGHERTARAGFGSSAALPLHRNGAVIGTFNLYSDEINAFDNELRELLAGMATDISFTLDNFARESQRKRAEEELRAAEERYRSLVEQSIAATYIIQDDKFAYVNPRCAEIMGRGQIDVLTGTNPLQWIAPADRDRIAEDLRQLMGGKTQKITHEFVVLCRDGSMVRIGANASRATYQGRPAIIGLLQDISERKRTEEMTERHMMQLKTAVMSTVGVATTISGMRDPYTAGHERRVAEVAAAIGSELGFDTQRLEGLRIAASLHDIGKIKIPSEILSKPGKLSAVEYRMIQGHANASYDVLKEVEWFWPVAEVALQHHERMDGSGYPQGLKGEEILLEARIMAVADVVEAMSSHRPYRAGLRVDQALDEIESGRGTLYDPEVADACLKIFREKGVHRFSLADI